jgi:Tfp pilus assembly PilM family ATPase
MKTSRLLGVSFYNGKIQVAEVEHGKHPTLTALAEADAGIDLSRAGTELSPDHPQLPDFIARLQELLKKSKIASKSISFALPPNSMFIGAFPVDPTLKGPELTSYLQWEVQQYNPDTDPKEFITDSNALPLRTQGAKQVLVVSIRRGVVGFLQQATAKLQLKLGIVDIDHFSTEKTLRVNYPEIAAHTVGLFGVRHGAIDASLVQRYDMVDYRPYAVNSSDEIQRVIAQYLKYTELRDCIGLPEALILHGTNVPREILKPLHEETGIQAIAFNALRKLQTSDKIKDQFGKESYRFTAAIGLALRTS